MEKKVTFCVKLAGVPIDVSATYDKTRAFCREYLTEENAAFGVEISPEDIARERHKAVAEMKINLLKRSREGSDTDLGAGNRTDVASESRDFETVAGRLPDSYLETLALYRKIVVKLLSYDILLFHGSAVAVDGIGYLFTACSGTGKSTHTRLWREQFGERAEMVNDDKPLLRFTESGVIVCGTPWDGKHHLSKNTGVPLKAICILERSEGNHIEKIGAKAAWPVLIQQSYRPEKPEDLRRTVALVDRLVSGVKLYRLGCNMEPEAAEVAYEGMQ